jgi:membrane-bound lytic murein transglycosylase
MRNGNNLDIIKFPHADSNNSKYMTLGIILGQLHKYRMICNSIRAFKKATQELVRHMIKRGHEFAMITRG